MMPLLCSIFMAPAICWRKSLMVSSLSVRIARKELKIPTDEDTTTPVLQRAQRAVSPQQLPIICHFYFHVRCFFLHTVSEFLQATKESICIPSLVCGQGCFSPESLRFTLMVNSGQWQMLNLGYQLRPKVTFGEG